MNDDNASRMILIRGRCVPIRENNLSVSILSIYKGFVFQVLCAPFFAAGDKSMQNECRLIQVLKGW